MLKKIVFLVLPLLFSISMAVQPISNFIRVPNEFEMWMIRIAIILVLFFLVLIGLICFCRKKKLKMVGIVIVSIGVAIGLISLVILNGQNKIRGGGELVVEIDYEKNEKIAQLNYIISNLFNFGKIDWNAITNEELNNGNIVRDVTKLYKEDIDRLLGTKDWNVIEKNNIETTYYKCIEWKIHFKDSNGREQEIVINNSYNPNELIISNDIIKVNKVSLDNLLGENNWTIKDEKFKHYNRGANYKEWTIGYTNLRNEYKEMKLQNDIEFGEQIQSYISNMLTDEATDILGANYRVFLLPNNGPRTKSSYFNFPESGEYLDKIDKNESISVNLRELNLIDAIKGNGINIIIPEEKNYKVIEEILNKLKKYTYEKYTVKFTFNDSKVMAFVLDLKEVTIIKSGEEIEKRYETDISVNMFKEVLY